LDSSQNSGVFFGKTLGRGIHMKRRGEKREIFERKRKKDNRSGKN
jgi:hypothetical protein